MDKVVAVQELISTLHIEQSAAQMLLECTDYNIENAISLHFGLSESTARNTLAARPASSTQKNKNDRHSEDLASMQEIKNLISQMTENVAEHEWLLYSASLIQHQIRVECKNRSSAALKQAHNNLKQQAALDPAFTVDQPAHRELVDLVVKISQAVNGKWGYFPRTNQLLAVLSLFSGAHRSGRGRLIEMATGEGKTVVVAMLAALMCLLGHKVDIVTSSQSLARRDAIETNDFFDRLSLKVACCAEAPVSKKEHDELSNFLLEHSEFQFTSRHIDLWCRARKCGDLPQNLQDPTNRLLYTGTKEHVQRHCRDTFPDLHVSELPIGRGEHRMFETYLPKACYNADVTYGTTLDYEGDLLRHELYAWGTRDMSDGNLRPLDVVICDECDSLQVDGALHSTQLANKIFGMSYLNLLLTVIWSQVCGLRERGIQDSQASGNVRYLRKDELIDHVTQVVRDALERGEVGDDAKAMQIRVPPHLTEFAKRQVRTLVASAYEAHEWREKEQYVIGPVDDGELDVLPVNLGTGETQNRMHYSDGLHEFLQMKHGIPLAEMSLVDNKMSNKALFKRYNLIFGLSGTLGDKPEFTYLKETYKVDIEKIPSHKKSQRKELPGLMYPDEVQWETAIVEAIKQTFELKRAVLIISATELMARNLEVILSSRIPNLSVRLYVRNESDKDAPKSIDCNQVIISTNLAGRGTDLNISENLERRGGLHVVVAYLPDNDRIKKQAFGRAGRKGQPGSAQVLACAGHLSFRFDGGIDPTIAEIPERLFSLVDRAYNEHETKRVRNLVKSCRGPDAAEACFMKLLPAISECRSSFRKEKKLMLEARGPRENIPKNHLRAHDADLRNFEDFAVAAVLEKFSFWKKSNEHNFGDRPDKVLSEFEQSCLPDCVALLRALTSKLGETSFPRLNIFLRIDKAVVHAFASQHQLASALYSEVISEVPLFCAFAHFNRAWSYIEQEKFDEADSDFDRASYLIQNEELPRLCSMAVMLGNAKKELAGQHADQLSTQIDLQQRVYVAVLSNIGEAKHTMAELRKEESTPGAYLVDSTPAAKMSLKSELDTKTQRHFRFLGLHGFVQVYCKKKKKSSFWDAVICGLIGVCQVVGGALLASMSCGLLAQIGYALIFEGISDIAYAVEHGIKGDFAWGSWAVKKAVSLAVTALTLGMGGFAGATAGKGAFNLIGQAIFNELATKGINYVADKFLQEAISSFVKTLGNEVKGAFIHAVKQMANLVGRFSDAIETAAYLSVADEKNYEAYINMLRDLMHHVLGKPTVAGMVSNVSGRISAALAGISKPANWVGTVIKFVQQISKTVRLVSRVAEIVEIFSGDRAGLHEALVSVPVLPVEQRKVQSISAVFSSRELCQWLEDIGAVQGQSVVADFKSKISSNIKKMGEKMYIETAPNQRMEFDEKILTQIEQVLCDCQTREKAQLKKQDILQSVLDSWAGMVSEYVVNMLTKELLEKAAKQLKGVAHSFSTKYLNSSAEMRNMVENYKIRESAVTILMDNDKPLLHRIAAVATTVGNMGGLSSRQITTLQDIAKFTTAVDDLVRGDISSALANMSSTTVGKSVLTAVYGSGEKALAVLGELPEKKLQEFACGAIAFVKGDVQKGLTNLCSVANLPPDATRLIDIGRKLHDGNFEGALMDLSRTDMVRTLSSELVKSKLGPGCRDLIQLAECAQQVAEGKFDQALDSLRNTRFAQKLSSELAKGELPQRLFEVVDRVKDGPELASVMKVVKLANAVRDGQIDIALEMVSGQIGQNISPKVITAIQTVRTIMSISKEAESGNWGGMFLAVADCIGDKDPRHKVVQQAADLFLRLFNTLDSAYRVWPTSLQSATSADFDAMKTVWQVLHPKEAPLTTEHCQGILRSVENRAFLSEKQGRIETCLSEKQTAMACLIALPHAVASGELESTGRILHKFYSTMKPNEPTPKMEVLLGVTELLVKAKSAGGLFRIGEISRAIEGMDSWQPDLAQHLAKVDEIARAGKMVLDQEFSRAAERLNDLGFAAAAPVLISSQLALSVGDAIMKFVHSEDTTRLSNWVAVIEAFERFQAQDPTQPKVIVREQLAALKGLAAQRLDKLAQDLRRRGISKVQELCSLGLSPAEAGALSLLLGVGMISSRRVHTPPLPKKLDKSPAQIQERTSKPTVKPAVYGPTDMTEEEALQIAIALSNSD